MRDLFYDLGGTLKRPGFWVGGGVLLAVLSAGFGFSYFQGRKAQDDERAFQEQIKLARADGIPTTYQEFAAKVPRAKPEENAASLYRQLLSTSQSKDVKAHPLPTSAGIHLVFQPDPSNRAAVKSFLIWAKPKLDLIDQATTKPHCWFDRDWSQGLAVLFPEYAQMKYAAKLLMLRASVAADEGRSKDAIADCHKAIQIANHAGEEPHVIARLVREAIYHIACRQLAYFCFTHRNTAEYRDCLKELVAAFPKPDLHAEHLGDLSGLLSLIDLSATPKGRADLGLKEEDIPPAARLFPLIAPAHAKARVVEGERRLWAALTKPHDQMAREIGDADKEIMEGMIAFPIALKLYASFMEGSDDLIPWRIDESAATVQGFSTFLRALDKPSFSDSIDTDGLQSPFDGRPPSYRFDGKQITIHVSGYKSDEGKAVELKVPPDSLFKKK